VRVDDALEELVHRAGEVRHCLLAVGEADLRLDGSRAPLGPILHTGCVPRRRSAPSFHCDGNGDQLVAVRGRNLQRGRGVLIGWSYNAPHSCTQAFQATTRPSLSPDCTSHTLTASTRSGRSCICPLMLLLTCSAQFHTYVRALTSYWKRTSRQISLPPLWTNERHGSSRHNKAPLSYLARNPDILDFASEVVDSVYARSFGEICQLPILDYLDELSIRKWSDFAGAGCSSRRCFC